MASYTLGDGTLFAPQRTPYGWELAGPGGVRYASENVIVHNSYLGGRSRQQLNYSLLSETHRQVLAGGSATVDSSTLEMELGLTASLSTGGTLTIRDSQGSVAQLPRLSTNAIISAMPLLILTDLAISKTAGKSSGGLTADLAKFAMQRASMP